MIKNIWSEFWGGMIEVNVVSTLRQVPGSAKYKYSDYEAKLDIYETGNGVVYGVII